ncbi:SAM-dependent methyltransferase [Verrucomicrobiota bacterium]|nr:SAM-dependent methyltransferase [Verrucomicrobiota bacterium]
MTDNPEWRPCPCAQPADESPVAWRPRLVFAARDYVTGDAFTVVECPQCGLVRTQPRLSAAALAKYYPKSYHGAAGARRFPSVVEWLQNCLYAGRAARVERAAGGRPGHVLDVGCGRGHLLRAFQRRGWQVAGTEIDRHTAELVRAETGADVRPGLLEAFAGADGGFDAVVLWHVLEHLHDPAQVLRDCARLLRPDGTLFVGVPDVRSWEARIGGNKWFHLDVPRHVTHFSRPVLRDLLGRAGFAVLAESSVAPEYDLFSFVQTMLNRLGLRHNILYNALRSGAARLFPMDATDWLQVLVSVLLAMPLSALFLPWMLATVILRCGATVAIIATKTSRLPGGGQTG